MKKIATILLLMICSVALKAENSESAQGQDNGSFRIKDFIFGHIANDYEFHITDIGKDQISVPLPVIVRNKNGRWFFFMSSKFHHKHESYNGFHIASEGKYSGQIVETLSDGSEYRPVDLSITKNVFTILLTVTLLSILFISIRKRYTSDPLRKPKGFQALLEPVILFVTEDIAKAAIGKGYEKYTSFLLTMFFLILTLNFTGLIPIFPFGANVTGNINVTAALALCTFTVTMISTTKAYWHHKLWTPGVPLLLKAPMPLMPMVEIISIFTGPLALVIRLFANILSGHMVVTVLLGLIFVFSSLGALIDSFISVIAIVFSIFMMILDVLVSFIQAYVFTLLSALYFASAKEG
ncbi:MAG: F0F1 ATP synthase subunit A [Prevotellaceae bacterium]|jgi:F-type H+-transporting ATPase subunit a|nr:F0F1 ATP synthase subunit A [Prevotellaceae bacterium]